MVSSVPERACRSGRAVSAAAIGAVLAGKEATSSCRRRSRRSPTCSPRSPRSRTRLNAVLLAHYTRSPTSRMSPTPIGDSLQLAQAAKKTAADVIVFAGVHFMARPPRSSFRRSSSSSPTSSAGARSPRAVRRPLQGLHRRASGTRRHLVHQLLGGREGALGRDAARHPMPRR